MLYRRLADLVVIIHSMIGVFFLFGAFLSRQYPWVALIHIPLAVWVSAAYILGWTCPLTPLENRLRKVAGSHGYECSFVDHYIGRIAGMNPPSESQVPSKAGRRNEIILGVFFSVITLALHAAKLDKYHNALWPPQSKPAGLGAAR